jgi:hypothetical protein
MTSTLTNLYSSRKVEKNIYRTQKGGYSCYVVRVMHNGIRHDRVFPVKNNEQALQDAREYRDNLKEALHQ